MVTLKCPHGTSISIQVAQYAKNTASRTLCPDLLTTTALPTISGVLTASKNIIIATESSEVKSVNVTSSNNALGEGCQWPDALQVNLLVFLNC